MLAEDPFVVDLERFHGPLDLLLHLIREQDLDIFDIPIARITEQFLVAIRRAERLEIESAGDFLQLAATLVRIKARMLFPLRGGEEPEDDPRADLVRRLLEYEHFREAARLLADGERERARLFRRGFAEPRTAPPAEPPPLRTRWEQVWAAAEALSERLAAAGPSVALAVRPVRLDEKMALVRDELSRAPRVRFAALVAPWGTRIHAVVSLLACLELARQHALRLRQARSFEPLWILRPRDGG